MQFSIENELNCIDTVYRKSITDDLKYHSDLSPIWGCNDAPEFSNLYMCNFIIAVRLCNVCETFFLIVPTGWMEGSSDADNVNWS